MIDPLSRLSAGSRAVIRHTLTHPDPHTGAHLNDVVGTLIALTADTVTIRNRTGEVTVPRERVVAAKAIPPRPTRRGRPHRAIAVEDLQRLMIEGHPPTERDHLGDWVLRAAGGYTGRANSVLPVGDPGMPLEDAATEVESWYAARGLPANVQLPFPDGASPGDDALGSLLLQKGYATSPEVLVLTAAPRELAGIPAPQGLRLTISTTVTEDFLAACEPRVQAAKSHAAAVLGGPADQELLLLHADRDVVAVARVPFHDGWAGLFGVYVQPSYRRRGLASFLTATAAGRARERSAAGIYLQVEAANTPATRVYERLGFTTHHRYAYLSCPTS